MLFPRRGYILSPFFLWLFIPYGETVRSQFILSMVIYPLRGNFLSIFFPGGNLYPQKNIIKDVVSPQGIYSITFSFYGYLSPTGNLLHIFFPGGNLYPQKNIINDVVSPQGIYMFILLVYKCIPILHYIFLQCTKLCEHLFHPRKDMNYF